MKNTSLRKISVAIFKITLLALGLHFGGCNDKSTNPDPPSALTLHYDKEQDSSPNLSAGRYEAAARFTSTQIGNLAGRDLIEVHYYLANKPETCRVKIYGQNSANQPGSVLYSADVTSATQAHQWNVHKLAQTVKLTSADIWISIEFTHSARQATIGCDPGPAVQDGDWLYSLADGAWRPLSQRTSISINWNIRGVAQ